MSIYEKGYNLDNIEALLNAERNNDLVDDFFRYSAPARDAYREALYDAASDYDRSCY